ncbi:hypothetical protein GCM10010269_34940 [Streptomyces humidus]|uniref:Uncharacterized protein n=1 Tax=Streptomyces humidus TaxID=52259 RepID=A0A918L3W6_9ACTN|nr:hypothetical protein [Streptomyces humidus]GGR92921.1 hypothetical protein GCM10010269_34940 [Streptomyces humidus]
MARTWPLRSTQETCRDLTRTGYGISPVSQVAETSRVQGQDLHGTDAGERLRQALGPQAGHRTIPREPMGRAHPMKG